MAVIELFALTSAAVVNVYTCVCSHKHVHTITLHHAPLTWNSSGFQSLAPAFTVCLPYCSSDVVVLRGEGGIPGLGIAAHLSPSPCVFY